MHKKKVAIISAVGIPANYSGYETLVEEIALDVSNHFDLYVYCSSLAYQEKLETYKGAKLVYLNWKANGIQSIFYDLHSVLNAIFKQNIRTFLVLGVGIGLFIPFLRIISPRSKFIVHLDGLEWKRSKWSFWVRKYLKLNEWLAGKFAHVVIADNIGIEQYITKKYKRESIFIEYGARKSDTIEHLEKINDVILPQNFDLSICRIVPENNTEMILKAYCQNKKNLVFVGNWNDSEFGSLLKEKYKSSKNIYLVDKTFDSKILSTLKEKARYYIHGHSVGGTNPSLIEAMYHSLPIIAFDVDFNRYTTFQKASYFKTNTELIEILENEDFEILKIQGEVLNKLSLKNYKWSKVSKKYKEVFDAN